jgi:outer membrane protein TolC
MKYWTFVAFVYCAALAAQPLAPATADAQLAALLEEAAKNNPDVLAARRELHAARQRVEPAAALDDPMLEAGVLNLPAQSRSFEREDMTMKMIGLTQRLPFPGKRALRQGVAEKEAQAVEQGVQELANRVRRDVKVAYFDLALVDESQRPPSFRVGIDSQRQSIERSREEPRVAVEDAASLPQPLARNIGTIVNFKLPE